ncbi:MAG: fibronectin type III domain-containing protein, partial [Acutalibacteraceae bacterium]
MKRTLSLCMALLMMVSVLFAVPFTASAANGGANAFNDCMVSDIQGLNDALVKAESGTRICLIGDITATPSFPYPIGVQYSAAKSGTVVLDLNGFSIDVTTTTMTNLFSISRMTDFYVINSDPDHDSSINFSTKKSGTDGNGSVFLLNNEQASLIVSGVDISLCKDSDYQPTGEVSIMSVINCKDFYRLHLYDSTLTNHTSIGSGIIFQPTSSNAYAQSDVEIYSSTIKSNSYCINYETSYSAAYMQFAYSLLDCDEYYYTAFDLPSSCTYTFGQISASGFKAYKAAANNTLVSISDSQKIVDFTDKADISFSSSRFGTHFHTAQALVNTMDGHYMICKTCGVFLSNEEHNGKIEAVAATCTTDGHTEGYDCSCGYNVRVEMIAPTGHQHTEEKAAVAATCTEKGYTAGVYCNDCETWISGHEEIAALGHTEVADAAVSATCTQPGKTAGKHCSVCGEITVAQTEVPALGHTIVTDKAVAATCTKTGLTEGKHCSVCGATLVAQTTVSKTSHTYKTTTTTKATTSKDGKKVTACTVCGKVSSTAVIYKASSIKLSKTTFTYNGKAQKPTVTVKNSKGTTLKNGTDYTVSYSSGCKNTGKYTITVKFKGNYSGSTKLTFNILPSKTSKLTVSQTTTSIKATWKAVTGATGYKVTLYNSSGKAVKTVDTTKTTYTFSKLSKGTTYKVRVTAYKTIDSKKVSSSVYTQLTTATKTDAPSIKVSSTAKKTAKISWS